MTTTRTLRDAEPRHATAVASIERAVGLASCLTLQSMAEFFSECSRKGVCPEQARRTSYRGLLVATAPEPGCSAILTEDLADGTVLGGVRVVNPFGSDGLSEAADRLLPLCS